VEADQKDLRCGYPHSDPHVKFEDLAVNPWKLQKTKITVQNCSM
jgi:hypothetical protein